ncbi:hypothetical protein SAMN05216548_1324 [Faunimonas pinastri]|uniref:Uncharacterized protein n=1 Tax=Faunimonas pinastri TaxID=1855383 RepID=A0A1H9QQ34_9HYPH|nr:hypothetical protein [Faunimonas pinastri]SER62554.1 hypothetical protein SAMN05216548_1324 [Faunimonas pinastri]
MIIFRMVTSLRAHFRVRSTEWLLAGLLANFGRVLLDPHPTFEGASYAELARFATEDHWGWACLVAGGLRLGALFVNGSLYPSYWARAGMAFVSCFFWAEISLGFFTVGTVPTGLAIYPLLLLAEVYNVGCAFKDAGQAGYLRAARKAGTGGSGRW